MAQIPPIGEPSHATPAHVFELLRPPAPVTPVSRSTAVNAEPDRQARQGADAAAANRAGRSDDAPEAADLADAVDEINGFLLGARTNLSFRVDDELGRLIVSVVDTESGEVVRQMPPEEALKIAQRIREAGFGLIDSTA